jgi:hypothetical protein
MNDETKPAGEKSKCPFSFCANLPVQRKVPVVAGVLIVLLAFLSSTVWSGFIWLLAALGAAMVYGGATGNCMLTKAICKLCGKDAGDCGKGSCG